MDDAAVAACFTRRYLGVRERRIAIHIDARPSPESPVVRWSARVLVAAFALWVAFVCVTVLSGRVFPSDLDSTHSRVIGLAFYGALIVCPTALVGWKAIQLSIGRGRTTTSTWTLSWLVFFPLTVAVPVLTAIRELA
jgi:hypothetical protein